MTGQGKTLTGNPSVRSPTVSKVSIGLGYLPTEEYFSLDWVRTLKESRNICTREIESKGGVGGSPRRCHSTT